MLVLTSQLFHEKVCKAAAFSIQYNPEAIFNSIGNCNGFIYIPRGSWVWTANTLRVKSMKMKCLENIVLYQTMTSCLLEERILWGIQWSCLVLYIYRGGCIREYLGEDWKLDLPVEGPHSWGHFCHSSHWLHHTRCGMPQFFKDGAISFSCARDVGELSNWSWFRRNLLSAHRQWRSWYRSFSCQASKWCVVVYNMFSLGLMGCKK